MKFSLWFVLTLAFVTGCANFSVTKAVDYTVNVGTILTSVRYIDKNIDSTVNTIYDNDFYTVDEQVKLDRLFSEIDFTLNRIEKIVDVENLDTVAIDTNDVELLIVDVRNIYSEMYIIVSAHYKEYSPETQTAITALNDNLIALDRAWNAVSKTPDGRDITPIVKGALKILDGGLMVSKMATVEQ